MISKILIKQLKNKYFPNLKEPICRLSLAESKGEQNVTALTLTLIEVNRRSDYSGC